MPALAPSAIFTDVNLIGWTYDSIDFCVEQNPLIGKHFNNWQYPQYWMNEPFSVQYWGYILLSGSYRSLHIDPRITITSSQ